MTKEEIKRKFGEVQGILDSLQGSDATCMFIGHEGNHFVISGSSTNISAQIVFAMMRYPIVRDIIKTCAVWFDDPVDIKYVHQLQHVLRLCGAEKEIELKQ